MEAPAHLSEEARTIWTETVERCGERVIGPNLEAYAT